MSTVELTPWNVQWITTQTTTTVGTGSATLGKLIIPTPVANATVKVYDGTAASGSVLIDTITLPASPTVLPTVLHVNLRAQIQITVVTAGATMSVGVAYR